MWAYNGNRSIVGGIQVQLKMGISLLLVPWKSALPEPLLLGPVESGQGLLKVVIVAEVVIQGDPSCCLKTSVDFRTKVPFWPGLS